jgi:hypothetical protein
VTVKAAKEGRSYDTLRLRTCKLEVLVVWSIVSPELDATMSWCQKFWDRCQPWLLKSSLLGNVCCA